jgi:hypothetical protein
MAEMQSEIRQFAVHAAHEGAAGGHTVEGASFEEAAVNFVETWHPVESADGDVSVIVRDTETGHEHCFLVEVATGAAGPCE